MMCSAGLTNLLLCGLLVMLVIVGISAACGIAMMTYDLFFKQRDG